MPTKIFNLLIIFFSDTTSKIQVKDFASAIDGDGSSRYPRIEEDGTHVYFIYNLHTDATSTGRLKYSFYLRFTSQFDKSGDRLMFGYGETKDEAKGDVVATTSMIYIYIILKEKCINVNGPGFNPRHLHHYDLLAFVLII